MTSALRVTPAYVGAICGVAAASSALLGPGQRRELARACSTNVDNLSAHRYRVLLTSLVVLDGPPRAGALLALAGVLGGAELLWGPAPLAAVAVGSHVGASLLVDAGLRAGLARGRLDPAVRGAVDVGTSYAALAVAGGLLGALPGRALPGGGLAALAGLLAAPLRSAPAPADAGHALAAALGTSAAALLLRRRTAAALSALRR